MDGNEDVGSSLRALGGSGTFLWVDPVARVASVALTDREFGDWAKKAWPALSDAVLDELES